MNIVRCPPSPSKGAHKCKNPEGKNCGQICREQWINEVGQVKKVRGDTVQWGDTRVKYQ